MSLALTVVVLGLSFAWLLGGGTGAVDGTADTEPVTTTDTPEQNVAVDGFTRRAVQRHAAVLSEDAYALRYVENRSNGSNFSGRVRSSPTDERLAATIRRGNTTVERYAGNGTISFRRTANGTTTYEGPTNLSTVGGFEFLHRSGTGANRLQRLTLVGNYTGAGTVTRDGRTLDRYTVDGLAPTATLNGTLERIEGTALIDQRGIVRSANLTLQFRQDGVRQRQTAEYRVTTVGDVSVERAGWLDEAREASTQSRQTTSSSG